MVIVFITLLLSTNLALSEDFNKSTFTGYVSRLNENAKLIRVRVNFKNLKFINKGNQIDLYSDALPNKRCYTKLLAKTNRYLLLKIPNYLHCVKNIPFTVGSFLHFSSHDLKKNIEVAEELIKLLIRKKKGIKYLLINDQKKLSSYIEKVEVINKRYKLLEDKLLLEWQDAISRIENDKYQNVAKFKTLENRMHDIDFKLEKYRIYDQNIAKDRWALDSNIYYKNE